MEEKVPGEGRGGEGEEEGRGEERRRRGWRRDEVAVDNTY